MSKNIKLTLVQRRQLSSGNLGKRKLSWSCSLACACLLAAYGCIGANLCEATPIWSGTTDDNWSVGGGGGNWSGSAAPGSSDSPQFQDTDSAGSAGTVTNIVDTDFTVTSLLYENTTGNFHTTQIDAGQTLTVTGVFRAGFGPAFSTDTSSVTVSGPGTLNFGTGGDPADIDVGLHSGASDGRAHVTATGLVQTTNLDSVDIGTGNSVAIYGEGTLDFSSATIVGGTFAVNNDVNVGTGRGGVGTLTFGSSLSTLSVGGSLNIGALSGGGTGGSIDTTGIVNLPGTSQLLVGAGGSGNLFVGEKRFSVTGNTDGSFTFDGTLGGTIDTVRVGVNVNNQGTATGVLDLSDATFPSGTFSAEQLEIGIGMGGDGTVTFNSSLSDLDIGESLRVGAGSTALNATVTSNADSVGLLTVPAGIDVKVGSTTPGHVRIGERTAGTGGGIDHDGNVTLSGGTFDGDMQTVYLGVNRTSLTSGDQVGVFDLSTTELVGNGFSVSGDIEVGQGFRTDGTLRIGSGDGSATNVTVGDDTVGVTGGFGLLSLHQTHLVINSIATIGLNGTVEVNVGEVSSGYDLTNSAAAALGITASSAGMSIVFDKDPLGFFYQPNPAMADDIFYGLRWAGDHVTDLQALMSGGLLSWDDTTFLTAPNNGQVSIFFDTATNATYVGFYATSTIPEPSSRLMLLAAALYLRRRRRASARL